MYSQKETDILNYAEMNKNKWKNMGIEYCTVEDERYPNTLKKITDRPVLLHLEAIFIIRIRLLRHTKNRAIENMSPNSSDIAENIKSFSATGILSGIP